MATATAVEIKRAEDAAETRRMVAELHERLGRLGDLTAEPGQLQERALAAPPIPPELEERLGRIESKIDALAGAQAGVKASQRTAVEDEAAAQHNKAITHGAKHKS